MYLTVCSCHVTYAFQSEWKLCSWLNVKELLAPSTCEIWSLSDSNLIWTQNHLIFKRTLNHLVKLTKWLNCVLNPYLCTVDLTVCSCHVTHAFQSVSKLYSCLNVKELLARSRRKIWSLSDCNRTRTQSHLILKRTLNKFNQTYQMIDLCSEHLSLYGAFDCMFLSCHIRFSEWIHTL